HRHAPGRAVLVFPGGRQPRLLTDQLGHRAIGVVYDPAHEHRGAYVPTVLGDRYDAFLWCDDTAAVRPLPTRPVPDLVPETYPTGV
ncbi:MAG TPA: erythromycin esterase family protein, partial [Pilimelia sp.]|nr:erythromycin esterase family protein [Pilimelia sp.]